MGFNFVSILYILDDKFCLFDDLDKYIFFNVLMVIEIGKYDILENCICGNK